MEAMDADQAASLISSESLRKTLLADIGNNPEPITPNPTMMNADPLLGVQSWLQFLLTSPLTSLTPQSPAPITFPPVHFNAPSFNNAIPGIPIPLRDPPVLVNDGSMPFTPTGVPLPFTPPFKLQKPRKKRARILKEGSLALIPYGQEERFTWIKRVVMFQNAMRGVLGDRSRRFHWSGSVTDSVVGAFLTQNVSDALSSRAYMELASRWPDTELKETADGVQHMEDTVDWDAVRTADRAEVADSIKCRGMHTMLATRIQAFLSILRQYNQNRLMPRQQQQGAYLLEPQQQPLLRPSLIEDNNNNKIVTPPRYTVQLNIEHALNDQGQQQRVSVAIIESLSSAAEQPQNGIVGVNSTELFVNDNEEDIMEISDEDEGYHIGNKELLSLEWLRDVSDEEAKSFLMSVDGLGRKSVACIMLLTLGKKEFPVDTNVGRICARLGWLPLDTSESIEDLDDYAPEPEVHSYLHSRLLHFDIETLYELHYNMITLGKVFCHKAAPNCTACPMQDVCEYAQNDGPSLHGRKRQRRAINIESEFGANGGFNAGLQQPQKGNIPFVYQPVKEPKPPKTPRASSSDHPTNTDSESSGPKVHWRTALKLEKLEAERALHDKLYSKMDLSELLAKRKTKPRTPGIQRPYFLSFEEYEASASTRAIVELHWQAQAVKRKELDDRRYAEIFPHKVYSWLPHNYMHMAATPGAPATIWDAQPEDSFKFDVEEEKVHVDLVVIGEEESIERRVKVTISPASAAGLVLVESTVVPAEEVMNNNFWQGVPSLEELVSMVDEEEDLELEQQEVNAQRISAAILVPPILIDVDDTVTFNIKHSDELQQQHTPHENNAIWDFKLPAAIPWTGIDPAVERFLSIPVPIPTIVSHQADVPEGDVVDLTGGERGGQGCMHIVSDIEMVIPSIVPIVGVTPVTNTPASGLQPIIEDQELGQEYPPVVIVHQQQQPNNSLETSQQEEVVFIQIPPPAAATADVNVVIDEQQLYTNNSNEEEAVVMDIDTMTTTANDNQPIEAVREEEVSLVNNKQQEDAEAAATIITASEIQAVRDIDRLVRLGTELATLQEALVIGGREKEDAVKDRLLQVGLEALEVTTAITSPASARIVLPQAKRRYHQLAMTLHPDKCKLDNAAAAFAALGHAMNAVTEMVNNIANSSGNSTKTTLTAHDILGGVDLPTNHEDGAVLEGEGEEEGDMSKAVGHPIGGSQLIEQLVWTRNRLVVLAHALPRSLHPELFSVVNGDVGEYAETAASIGDSVLFLPLSALPTMSPAGHSHKPEAFRGPDGDFLVSTAPTINTPLNPLNPPPSASRDVGGIDNRELDLNVNNDCDARNDDDVADIMDHMLTAISDDGGGVNFGNTAISTGVLDAPAAMTPNRFIQEQHQADDGITPASAVNNIYTEVALAPMDIDTVTTCTTVAAPVVAREVKEKNKADSDSDYVPEGSDEQETTTQDNHTRNVHLLHTVNRSNTVLLQQQQDNNVEDGENALVEGILLVSCRAALKLRFPLNGTYFQSNEVFVDNNTVIEPIKIPKAWLKGTKTSAIYFGIGIHYMTKFMTQQEVAHMFTKGWVCFRAFDPASCAPMALPNFLLPSIPAGGKSTWKPKEVRDAEKLAKLGRTTTTGGNGGGFFGNGSSFGPQQQQALKYISQPNVGTRLVKIPLSPSEAPPPPTVIGMEDTPTSLNNLVEYVTPVVIGPTPKKPKKLNSSGMYSYNGGIAMYGPHTPDAGEKKRAANGGGTIVDADGNIVKKRTRVDTHPKMSSKTRCGYCKSCLNRHWKKACDTRRAELDALILQQQQGQQGAVVSPVQPGAVREPGNGLLPASGSNGPSVIHAAVPFQQQQPVAIAGFPSSTAVATNFTAVDTVAPQQQQQSEQLLQDVFLTDAFAQLFPSLVTPQ